MIIGIGVDIIEIGRVQKALQNTRFQERVFAMSEQEYCTQKANPWESYATIFAAKEATAKALGVGFGKELGWLDMEITHTLTGAPQVIFCNKGLELAKKKGVKTAWVSLSHSKENAIAMVVLEG